MFEYPSHWPSLVFGTAFQRDISAVARRRLRRAGSMTHRDRAVRHGPRTHK